MAGIKSMPAAGLTMGKKAGTIIAVAILLNKLNVVKFWILPPNFPAIIGAAVAVGIITHIISPCDMIAISLADIPHPILISQLPNPNNPKYTPAVSSIWTANTIQCHRRKRKSSGLILQKVKKSIRKISGDKSQSRWRNHGYPTAPTTIAIISAYLSIKLLMFNY
jgi:hypothetical protein